jgi:hypothetical protein
LVGLDNGDDATWHRLTKTTTKSTSSALCSAVIGTMSAQMVDQEPAEKVATAVQGSIYPFENGTARSGSSK